VTGPDPAVAACRLAVRRALAATDAVVMVACSGGADSLALLAATVFEARAIGARAIGVVVDHGLQAGSKEHTARVVDQMAALGVDETASIAVTVDPGPHGIEAGAREARYVALGQLAEHFGASQVLLGHTLDDQAETVLLGLTRGSGGRSIAGMRRTFDQEGTAFARPLLDVTRAQTEAACTAEGIEWWSDPHNEDPRFVRSRVRHTVMPLLERELGPGIAAALARTADSAREDVDALDAQAELALSDSRSDDGWDCVRLRALGDLPALQTRVVRLAALEAGASPSELTRDHVLDVVAIVVGPDPTKQIRLPGLVTAYREADVLRFRPTPPLR
jgi:tRNA(Ile)-lysidine synthase